MVVPPFFHSYFLLEFERGSRKELEWLDQGLHKKRQTQSNCSKQELGWQTNENVFKSSSPPHHFFICPFLISNFRLHRPHLQKFSPNIKNPQNELWRWHISFPGGIIISGGRWFARLIRRFFASQMDITKQSLEVKLPTIWTDEAAEVGRVREEKGTKKKSSEKGNSQKKEE